jgi:ABC-2 type transport system permease protein
MRALLAGRPFPATQLLGGGAVAVVELLLACLFYAGVYRHAMRTGLLARYSAEGAS